MIRRRFQAVVSALSATLGVSARRLSFSKARVFSTTSAQVHRGASTKLPAKTLTTTRQFATSHENTCPAVVNSRFGRIIWTGKTEISPFCAPAGVEEEAVTGRPTSGQNTEEIKGYRRKTRPKSQGNVLSTSANYGRTNICQVINKAAKRRLTFRCIEKYNSNYNRELCGKKFRKDRRLINSFFPKSVSSLSCPASQSFPHMWNVIPQRFCFVHIHNSDGTNSLFCVIAFCVITKITGVNPCINKVFNKPINQCVQVLA